MRDAPETQQHELQHLREEVRRLKTVVRRKDDALRFASSLVKKAGFSLKSKAVSTSTQCTILSDADVFPSQVPNADGLPSLDEELEKLLACKARIKLIKSKIKQQRKKRKTKLTKSAGSSVLSMSRVMSTLHTKVMQQDLSSASNTIPLRAIHNRIYCCYAFFTGVHALDRMQGRAASATFGELCYPFFLTRFGVPAVADIHARGFLASIEHWAPKSNAVSRFREGVCDAASPRVNEYYLCAWTVIHGLFADSLWRNEKNEIFVSLDAALLLASILFVPSRGGERACAHAFESIVADARGTACDALGNAAASVRGDPFDAALRSAIDASGNHRLHYSVSVDASIAFQKRLVNLAAQVHVGCSASEHHTVKRGYICQELLIDCMLERRKKIMVERAAEVIRVLKSGADEHGPSIDSISCALRENYPLQFSSDPMLSTVAASQLFARGMAHSLDDHKLTSRALGRIAAFAVDLIYGTSPLASARNLQKETMLLPIRNVLLCRGAAALHSAAKYAHDTTAMSDARRVWSVSRFRFARGMIPLKQRKQLVHEKCDELKEAFLRAIAPEATFSGGWELHRQLMRIITIEGTAGVTRRGGSKTDKAKKKREGRKKR